VAVIKHKFIITNSSFHRSTKAGEAEENRHFLLIKRSQPANGVRLMKARAKVCFGIMSLQTRTTYPACEFLKEHETVKEVKCRAKLIAGVNERNITRQEDMRRHRHAAP
jgi:hypothetical protein